MVGDASAVYSARNATAGSALIARLAGVEEGRLKAAAT